MRLFFLGFIGFMTSAAMASIPYNVVNAAYFEDFNTLPTANQITNLNNWVNNGTLQGWHRLLTSDGTASGVTERWRVDDGSASGGALCSFGTLGSTDRALGGVPSSNIPVMWFGVEIRNLTGANLDEFSLSYFGEQWRQGNTGNQKLKFSYGLGNASISTGTWTEVSSLDFSAPRTNPANGASLDGNLAANRLQIGATVTGLNWNSGESLWLRWEATDASPLPGTSGGGDHGLAVDDLEFRAVPEPGTMVALGLGVAALLRRKVSARWR